MWALVEQWQGRLYAVSVGFVACWILSYISSWLVSGISILMILSSAAVRSALCATRDPQPDPFVDENVTESFDELTGDYFDEV